MELTEASSQRLGGWSEQSLAPPARFTLRRRVLVSLAVSGLVLGVVAVGGRVVSVYTVRSASMEPTLHCAAAPGCRRLVPDKVVVARIIPPFMRITRGDVVVFRRANAKEMLIKRVVGLPGDTVAVLRGVVYVDGRTLPERYVTPGERGRRGFSQIRVPAGRYFVLGDNRRISVDSRNFGPIAGTAIVGKLLFNYQSLSSLIGL